MTRVMRSESPYKKNQKDQFSTNPILKDKIEKRESIFLKDPKPKKMQLKEKKQVLHENEMKHNTMLNDGLKNNFN